MKSQDIPQDPSALDKFTKEVCYVVDDAGQYGTALSRGWEIKAEALGVTWEEIEARIAESKEKIKQGKASPILYYMELRLMDIEIVAAYTGLWKWQVKRHLKPNVFAKLSEKRLKKYAEVFEITIEDLRNFGLK